MPLTIADVPAWAKPARQQIAAGVWAWAGSQYPEVCRITVQQSDGAVIFYAGSARTLTAAGGWISVCMSYRSAS